MFKKKNKKVSEIIKNIVASSIMIVSTSIIIFNNVGQTIQLIQVPLSRTIMYWIASVSFVVGAVWTSYLNKLLKI